MTFEEGLLLECEEYMPTIKGDMGSVEPVMEWIKWLSYISDEEIEEIASISRKKSNDINSKEYEFLLNIQRSIKLVQLLKKYHSINSKFSKEEKKMIYYYFLDNSIEDLMSHKLTDEEKGYAKVEIDRLKNIPNEELEEKITKEQRPENYIKLSMIDAYILNKISHISFLRHKGRLNRVIKREIESSFNKVDLVKTYSGSSL